MIAARRTAKTLTAGMLTTYLGTLVDYSDVLVRGETGVILCLAQDQRVATQILDYVEQNLRASPILRQRFVRRTQDSIELTGNIKIEVRPASFRKLRGPTYLTIICDELSFWYVEDYYSNPDVEVLNAARPGLLTTRGMLILLSSPYAKRGVLWEVFKKHFGRKGDPLILVAKGTTRQLNPTISEAEIERELERDPVRNRAELLAEFRDDVAGVFILERLQRRISVGVYERAPQRGVSYFAFCDPSAGASDAMTLAIAHYERNRETIVIDAVREIVPPFSPEATVFEFATLLKKYHVSKLVGDRFAGQWVVEQFSKATIRFDHSEKVKSELFLDLLALVNSGRIDLLDHPKLVTQLTSLERRPGHSGKDIIDHPVGAHDDIANVIAGCASLGISNSAANHEPLALYACDTNDPADPQGIDAWRRARLAWFLHSGGMQPPF